MLDYPPKRSKICSNAEHSPQKNKYGICLDCQRAYDKWYSAKNAIKKRTRAAEWFQNNKEKSYKYRKEQYKKHRDRIYGYTKKYIENNKEKALESRRLSKRRNWNKQKFVAAVWKTRNRDKICFYASKRRAMKLLAMPIWANEEAIKEFYKNCPKGYEVDHIIPLQGKTVCGLHIVENLQYLTPKENQIKGNKLVGF